jgi:hypothetical protein
LALVPGTTVEVSPYCARLHLMPMSRTARIQTVRGSVVATSGQVLTDEVVFNVLDAGRRTRYERVHPPPDGALQRGTPTF